MSNNIIDFNQHKQNRGGASQGDELSMDELMESLEDLPDNGLMNSVGDFINGRMMKQLILTDIGKRVSAALEAIEFDPDDFILDEESAERFLSADDITDSDTPFNGPFFDWYADDALVRVVTVFQEDEEDQSVNLLISVMKLDDGADSWQIFSEGQWINDGPPADFFDDLMDGFDDDWDDDEEDEALFRQEPWEDEYDESIYSLYLSPQAYRALSRAGIETIEQLSKLTDLELLALDGIDGQELAIIREALDDGDFDDEDAAE